VSKTKRFAGLKDLAGDNERKAAQRLAAALQALEAKKQELDQLKNYMDDYQSSAVAATDTARLENLRLFMSRLSQAIQAQEGSLAAAQARYQAEAERWKALKAQTQALDQLLDKYTREERHEEVQAEQKELDEQVARPKKSF
jgi:flagellar export protein FliJ